MTHSDAPAARETETARLNFFGDVCLDGINTDSYAIDQRITTLAASADCNVANLESPLTDAIEGLPYQAHLIKAIPAPSRVLDLFDVFSLANNHIMDYKEAGLSDTITLLRSLEKSYFGAGRNRDHAFIPLLLERRGHRIAFLAFTRWHRATRRSAGATPDHIRRLARAVRELRRSGCFVVVYPHWNYEYVDYPAPSSRRTAKRLIDAGADLVVGAHPHIVQGYETYRGKLIFHSLGNFVFDPGQLSRAEKGDYRINQSVVLTVTLHKDRSYDYAITPVHTDRAGVCLLEGQKAATLLKRLADLSNAVADDALCRQRFYNSAVHDLAKVSSQMGSMIKKKGPMYILSRLHRAQLEDVKIELHALARRRIRRSPNSEI